MKAQRTTAKLQTHLTSAEQPSQGASVGPLTKIISGGQNGADRAALEAAYDAGIETGGWATKGYWTHTGQDPLLGTKFKLKELEGNHDKIY